jgi:hypothetical protein
MSLLIKAYYRLLADISMLTGVPIGAPDDIDLSWVLIDAPVLDKKILLYLECNKMGEIPILPEWLTPLWNKFILTDDPVMLKYIRQVLVFCYKAEFEPTEIQLDDAQASFIECDMDIDTWNLSFAGRHQEPLFRTARTLIAGVLYKCDWSNIIPSHGPGAVYPPRDSWDKSKFDTIYRSIQEYYPFDQYFCGLPSQWYDTLVLSDDKLKSSDSIVAKLIAVPKDSRGPRLICVHPAEAIWIQQGQRRLLEDAINRSHLIAGRIAFRDQSVNGSIALSSSLSQEYCTLDLKEASDRISCELVKYLFQDSYRYIASTRATHVNIDGYVLELRKFAPMGNCLTFPLQSLIFWSLVRAGISCRYGEICDHIYVFGDDIIFPRKYYDGVIRALVTSGLVPNVSKTFKSGFFRESCGVDAYRGINVTPHRIRVCDTSSVSNLISLCSLAKRMRVDGYNEVSAYLYSRVRAELGHLPLGNNVNSQGIYEYVDWDLGKLMKYEKIRFNRDLHIYESPISLVKVPVYRRFIHDWYHVQDSLLNLFFKNGFFSDRGTEYSVSRRVRLIRGWTTVNY